MLSKLMHYFIAPPINRYINLLEEHQMRNHNHDVN